MSDLDLTTLSQRWPAPSTARPIFFIGAGGIVADAHIPAYRALDLPIAGLFDVDAERARSMADRFSVRAFDSISKPPSGEDWIYDIAVPPEHVESTLQQIPEGSAVLIQKPMGRNLDEATRILELARKRRLTAALNFQLRFSPMVLGLLDALNRGHFGTLTDVEVRVQCHMPWELWPFLQKLERMELALHSIHYLDAIRAVLGEPIGVHARTLSHPEAPKLASTRSTAILEFEAPIRCCLTVNHHHRFGSRFAASQIRVEGTEGAAVLKMGVNLSYPEGEPDELWLARKGDPDWQSVPLAGQWFPDAFRGPMSNLQRYVAGEDETLVTRLEDAWKTMALVEACYQSNASPLTPVPNTPPAP